MGNRLTLLSAPLVALLLALTACSSEGGSQESTAASTPATSTSSSESSSSGSPDSSAAADLTEKILTGTVDDLTFQRIPKVSSPDEELAGADIQMTPESCAVYGLPTMDAASAAQTMDQKTYLIQIGQDTTYSAKYLDYTNRCTAFSGTVNGITSKGTMTIMDTAPVSGVTDQLAVLTDHVAVVNGSEVVTKTYLLTGNYNGVGIVVSLVDSSTGEPDEAKVMALFQAQIEKLQS